jgi:hypothetical protein
MKYCYECGHVTAGEPLFCQFCGHTYDVKLCPRMHANPRFAEVCSQCGSRDFSIPQPKVSLAWRIGAVLVRILLGASRRRIHRSSCRAAFNARSAERIDRHWIAARWSLVFLEPPP